MHLSYFGWYLNSVSAKINSGHGGYPVENRTGKNRSLAATYSDVVTTLRLHREYVWPAYFKLVISFRLMSDRRLPVIGQYSLERQPVAAEAVLLP